LFYVCALLRTLRYNTKSIYQSQHLFSYFLNYFSEPLFKQKNALQIRLKPGEQNIYIIVFNI